MEPAKRVPDITAHVINHRIEEQWSGNEPLMQLSIFLQVTRFAERYTFSDPNWVRIIFDAVVIFCLLDTCVTDSKSHCSTEKPNSWVCFRETRLFASIALYIIHATMAEGYQVVSNYSGNNVILDGFSNASMDNTLDGTQQPSAKQQALLKQSTPMVVVFCLAYILVFIFAIVNNSLVVSVIYRNPQMRTVTNYFLANLAVADIMVSFLVLPITLLSNLFTGRYFCLFYYYFILFMF